MRELRVLPDKIEHLVWLGCGEAEQPNELFDKAVKLSMVDARKRVIDALKIKLDGREGVQLIQSVIGDTVGEAPFFHYSLPEYSALSTLDGLLQLFPGLKEQETEQVELRDINVVMGEFKINTPALANMLVLDIADQAKQILDALVKRDNLKTFGWVQVSTGLEPLYQGAATQVELIDLLSSQGYEVVRENVDDPDLPQLTFRQNPLWQDLQSTKDSLHASQLAVQAQSRLQAENKEREKSLTENVEAQVKENTTLKQMLEQEKSTLSRQLETLRKLKEEESAALIKKLELANQKIEEQKNEFTKQLAEAKQQEERAGKLAQQKESKLQADLEQVAKQAAERLDKIAHLESTNRRLSDTSIDLTKRQHVLERELFKAQAQIEIIKELLLKP